MSKTVLDTARPAAVHIGTRIARLFFGARGDTSTVPVTEEELGELCAGCADMAFNIVERDKADLLEACKAAKKYLEPDLVEPGRTVFWSLVNAIAKAEGRA